MRSVKFKTALYGAATRLGLNPYSEDGLDVNKHAELVGDINDWVREGWEYDWWAELMVCEYRAVTTHGTTSVRYVPWAATDKVTIGTVLRVYKLNPLVSRYPWRLPWTRNADGVVVNDLAPDNVWVQFRRRAPEFTHLKWASGTTYAADALCYYEDTGECYKSLQAANKGKNPVTQTDWWEKVEFPVWLRPFVIGMAYASGLDDEDQEGARARAEGRAYARLMNAADVEMLQQGEVMVAEMENG